MTKRSKTQRDFFILFCGDTFLRTRDGSDPFALIRSCFRDSQVCINLETSLKGKKKIQKNVSLSVKEEAFDLIPENVRFVNIVNNHVADSGDPGNLASALEKRSKIVIGPDNPFRTHATFKGMEVDFFAAYFGLPRFRISYNGAVANELESMIRCSNARHRIVNIHWGWEHTDVPAPFQRALARRLVDAGASIIIGHHPHFPQGWEIYCGVPIFYSLGNFNFWQFDIEIANENRWGYMVRYDLETREVEAIPYRINKNYQPVAVSAQEKDDMTTMIGRLSNSVRSIDEKTWFAKYYSKWRSHEFHVWIKQCRKTKSPALLLKFMIWLILPIQIRYYASIFSQEK